MEAWREHARRESERGTAGESLEPDAARREQQAPNASEEARVVEPCPRVGVELGGETGKPRCAAGPLEKRPSEILRIAFFGRREW